MTLLSIVKRACVLVSMTPPSQVFGASSGIADTMLALAQIEGEELLARHPWPGLRTAATFTALGQIGQTGKLPADYASMVKDTVWNQATNVQLLGPATSASWSREAAGDALIAYPNFRIGPSGLQIQPAPAAGDTISLEYISNAFVQPASGSPVKEWAADTDTARIPERLIMLGMVWRWKKAKGLDYGEDMVTYERAVELAAGDDAGEISTAGRWDDDYKPPLPAVIVA